MLFDYDIVVPAGTPKETPEIRVCVLTSGLLNEIRVKFPPGPATLVHITVQDSLHQILPVNADGDLNLDDETVISSNLKYKLQAPFEVSIVGWSPFAVYEHTITCQFDVVPDIDDPFINFEKQLFTDRTGNRK